MTGALVGHWFAFWEGIGGALAGIGGHWWALEVPEQRWRRAKVLQIHHRAERFGTVRGSLWVSRWVFKMTVFYEWVLWVPRFKHILYIP